MRHFDRSKAEWRNFDRDPSTSLGMTPVGMDDRRTIADIHDGLQRKEFSAEELTRSYLKRIADHDAELGCYLHVMTDDALAVAKRVDAAIARGEDVGTLAGVPLAVKDNILISGVQATAGSKILEPYRAAYDATVIQKLRTQDAVFLGKTNCDEFAMGSSTETSAYQKTKNPWDTTTVPGGSSGGSAAAVAADLCVASFGSDTGGSIRQPASLCGVVGLKPTYGAVSRYGLIAMASSFDVIGPFTRNVADARPLFEIIQGKDVMDATSSDGERRGGFYTRPQADVKSAPTSVRDLRIGIPKEYFASGIDPDVEQRVREAIRVLEKLGCFITEVSLPHTEYGLAVYYVLMPSEVSTNLERFDGIRYGASIARDEPNAALDRVYHETRTKGFGPEVRRRIMLGTYALSAGYADQYYKRALAVRQLLKRDFQRVFEQVDVLVTPTSPTPAWPFGAKMDDPLAMYLSDVFTVSANVAGIPAMSLPCGFVERPSPLPEGGAGAALPFSERGSGRGRHVSVGGARAGAQRNGKRLPVGLQLMSRWFDEETLFTLGEAYEQATEWRQEHPIK